MANKSKYWCEQNFLGFSEKKSFTFWQKAHLGFYSFS